MDIQRLVIADPSGNKTAIIFDMIATENMRTVSKIIQNEFPDIEQVMFVQERKGMFHGEMAGGEFCGNAARALGYVLTDGKPEQLTLTMSGLAAPVVVNVRDAYSEIQTAITLREEVVSLGNAPVKIVHLEGISHAIIFANHPLFDFLKEYAARLDRWNTIVHVLEDLNISRMSASGLIFVDTSRNDVEITPYVFVKAVNTLFAEMACASGSIAVASLIGGEGALTKKCVHLRQPSGETLSVELVKVSEKTSVKVGGSMRVLYDGPMRNLSEELGSLYNVADAA